MFLGILLLLTLRNPTVVLFLLNCYLLEGEMVSGSQTFGTGLVDL